MSYTKAVEIATMTTVRPAPQAYVRYRGAAANAGRDRRFLCSSGVRAAQVQLPGSVNFSLTLCFCHSAVLKLLQSLSGVVLVLAFALCRCTLQCSFKDYSFVWSLGKGNGSSLCYIAGAWVALETGGECGMAWNPLLARKTQSIGSIYHRWVRMVA